MQFTLVQGKSVTYLVKLVPTFRRKKAKNNSIDLHSLFAPVNQIPRNRITYSTTIRFKKKLPNARFTDFLKVVNTINMFIIFISIHVNILIDPLLSIIYDILLYGSRPVVQRAYRPTWMLFESITWAMPGRLGTLLNRHSILGRSHVDVLVLSCFYFVLIYFLLCVYIYNLVKQ